jgi:HK97 family phage major capsid protein
MEDDIKKINSSLKEVGDQLKTFAEQSQTEIKAHAKLSEETKAKVDELLTHQGELQARLASAEQLMAKLEQGGLHSEREPSPGEQVTESEDFKAFAIRAAKGSSFCMPVKAAITEGAGSGADLIVPQRVPGVVTPPMQRLTIRDLLSWGRTTSNSVEFVRESGFTNLAAPVSENPSAGKPESQLTFEMDSAPVVTIAHWIHASKQVLSDVPMLQSYIDGRLRYGLKLVEEAQLLNGSGVGLNIDGIYTQATAYSQPAGSQVQFETMIDRLRLALLQVELAEYSSDGIVLNPIDWANLELIKTTDNAYLYSNPRFMTAPGLWGRPVVSTQAMGVGDFLTGAFQLGAQGWDREDARLIVSLEDRDNVIKNMVTLLMEERLALTVYRPEAFVKGDFDGLPVT